MSVTLTYEKLFDFLREERNNASLQKLPASFYQDVIDYLKAKEASIEALQGSGSITVDNSVIQYRNAKKIIENIYERREKKLLMLGLNKSRTKSQLIDTSTLLPEEKIFFKQLCIVLDHFRDEILVKILDKALPEINNQKDSISPEMPDVSAGIDSDKSLEEDISGEESSAESEESSNNGVVSVKFNQYVDKFVGPDLDILGPFDEGDVEKLAPEVAEVVISKGFADKV